MEHCELCDRSFPHSEALEQHRRMSSKHAYCSRCQKDFPSQRAKQQHLQASSAHHICSICHDAPDFDSKDALAQHDVDEHNICFICGDGFASPSNLESHRLVHKPKAVPCPGCDRKFVSNSAMLLHLEVGTCDSGVGVRAVTTLAYSYEQSKKYTPHGTDDGFKCPTCPASVTTISGLFQHVESSRCNGEVARGTPLWEFLRFLRSRLGRIG